MVRGSYLILLIYRFRGSDLFWLLHFHFPFGFLTSTIRKAKPVSMHLQQIVHDAVESPLNAHLLFPSQTEPIQAETAPDIGEDGLDRRHPSSVDELACYRIYLLPHLLRERFRLLIGLPGKVGELTRYCHVGVLHALRPDLAGEAISLGSMVLDSVQSVMDCIAAFVHPLAGRADAETLVGTYSEVARLEDDGSVKFLGHLFIEPFLMSVRLREPGIAVSKLVVGDVCVDAALNYHLHVLFGVEPAVGGQFGLFEDILFLADGLKVLSGSFDHGFQYCLF